jgi:hypothetical protein
MRDVSERKRRHTFFGDEFSDRKLRHTFVVMKEFSGRK